jgi:hypothetical protein
MGTKSVSGGENTLRGGDVINAKVNHISIPQRTALLLKNLHTPQSRPERGRRA